MSQAEYDEDREDDQEFDDDDSDASQSKMMDSLALSNTGGSNMH